MNFIPEKCWVCQEKLITLSFTTFCPISHPYLSGISFKESHFLVRRYGDGFYMFVEPYWVIWTDNTLEIEHQMNCDPYSRKLISIIKEISFETFQTLNILENIQNFVILS